MGPVKQCNFSKDEQNQKIVDDHKLNVLGIKINDLSLRIHNLLESAEKADRLERFVNLVQRAETDDRLKRVLEIAKKEKDNPLDRGYFKVIIDFQFRVSWSRFFGSQTCEICQKNFEPYGRGTITNLKTNAIATFSTNSLHKIAEHGFFSMDKERIPPLKFCQAVYDNI